MYILRGHVQFSMQDTYHCLALVVSPSRRNESVTDSSSRCSIWYSSRCLGSAFPSVLEIHALEFDIGPISATADMDHNHEMHV